MSVVDGGVTPACPVLVVDLGSVRFFLRDEVLVASTSTGQVLGVCPPGDYAPGSRQHVFDLLDGAARDSHVSVDGSSGPVSARVAWYNPFTFTVTCGSVDDEDHAVFRLPQPLVCPADGVVVWRTDDAARIDGRWVSRSSPSLEDVERDIAAHQLV